jgi:hypothetical protein
MLKTVINFYFARKIFIFDSITQQWSILWRIWSLNSVFLELSLEIDSQLSVCWVGNPRWLLTCASWATSAVNPLMNAVSNHLCAFSQSFWYDSWYGSTPRGNKTVNLPTATVAQHWWIHEIFSFVNFLILLPHLCFLISLLIQFSMLHQLCRNYIFLGVSR